mmetsp:Transcript_23178/g.50395  ORF Transcript_23178/g.50395 Transcript_23178/m.50395 type:complete len:216 (-) Transcript_23178:340-987(-)
MLAQVEKLENVLCVGKLLGEIERRRLVGRPEPRGQNMHTDVKVREPRLHRRIFLERKHDVSAEVNVLEHALELVGERGAALLLELGNHRLFRVDGSGFAHEKSLGQVLLEKGFKHIFALDVSEDDHDAVQNHLHLLCRRRFVPRLEFRINELGDEFCWLVLSDVDEAFKGVLESVAQVVVVLKRFGQHKVQLGLEHEQVFNHVFVCFLIGHDLSP